MKPSLAPFAAPAIAGLSALLLLAFAPVAQALEPASEQATPPAAETSAPEVVAGQRNPLELPSLITATPEDGFRLALKLARLGVSQTQHDKAVLHAGRAEYAHDSAQLIQASQTVAIHFQTVAQANNFWRD
ncbi:MAG: hexameric tyrosine-coordinated heme protein [Xanthomonadales bacterium]|nr:hexameric tyrosine-coordinated heme protein [Xanthomonadales bacterium]